MPNPTYERFLFRALVDYMPHRIYAKDTDGRFVFANKAVAVGMGASDPSDLLGRTDFEFYPVEDATKYAVEERRIMESGVPMVNHEEHVHYTRTNSQAWMLTTKVPLLDKCGTVLGIAGINYDITLRKESEQALRDAKLEAEQAIRAKSEFLAAMSHELRTPLNAMLGYAKILQSHSGLSDQQTFGLGTIERSGQHLLLLINDLLDISRLETGDLEPCACDVHLHDLLQGVGNIIRLKASEKSLAFSRKLVEAMGGSIDVRSTAGEGSVFSFELSLPVEAIWCAGNLIQMPGCDYPQLPASEMQTLQFLAKSGNMREIGRFAARLMMLGSEYETLAEALAALADRFESKAILDLVKRLEASSSDVPAGQPT